MPVTRQIEARGTRAAEVISLGRVEDDPRTAEVEVSFSSEAPVRRWGWDDTKGEVFEYLEVLGHRAGEPDLSILNAGAPVLKDHVNSIDAKVGRVARAWLDGDRGRAVLTFSDTSEGRALAGRVASGDVTDISFGYEVLETKRDGSRDGLPVFRATRWLVREISWVAVPADPSVGYGRGDDGQARKLTLTDEEPAMSEPTNASAAPVTATPETRAAEPRAAAPAGPSADQIRADAERAAESRMTAELSRRDEIAAIAEQCGMGKDAVRKAITEQVSIDAFRKSALDHMTSAEATRARETASHIGLTHGEVGKFSFARLCEAIANPLDRDAASAAAFELDACRAASRAKGDKARSNMTLPTDVLSAPDFIKPLPGTRAAGANAMTTGVAADGGALVPVDYMAGSFIDALINSASITRAGATVLNGLMGDVDIPKEISGPGFAWIGEGADATETKSQVGTVPMTPHTISGAVEYTRRMRIQADPSIEGFMRRSLVSRIALGVDRTALLGHTDAAAPQGLYNYLTPETWAAANTLTRDELIDLRSAIGAANVSLGGLKMILNYLTLGEAEKTKLDAGSGRFLYEGGSIVGVPPLLSNQIGDYQIVIGDFSQFLIGFWSGLDLRVDTATRAASDGVIIRAFQDCDFQVRHAEAFAWIENA